MGEAVSEMENNKELLQGSIKHLQEQNLEGFKEVTKIWNCIYGSKDKNIKEKLEKIEDNLKVFWNDQIEALEDKKRCYMNSIVRTQKEALQLEKDLGLSSGCPSMNNDTPLVELEEQLWKMLNKYQELKDLRLQEYSDLQNREIELCSILNEQPQLHDLSLTLINASLKSRLVHSDVPSCEELNLCKKRIKDLEEMETQLEYEFNNYKEELKSLLNDCGITPFSKFERFACSLDNDDDLQISMTREHFEKLKSKTLQYRNNKESMIAEANEYRDRITTMSKKLLMDSKELETFLNNHSGFGVMDLNALKKRLEIVKEERKSKLKDLILNERKQLDELWTRCFYSDNQKAEFKPYWTDSYSDDILTLHELEVERLEHFYNENKRIFQLTDKHKELWTRLLVLEKEASQTNRLFDNRGGKLLLEEKERKLIQKKVPAIRDELIQLVNQYKAANGNDFLYFGDPLLELLERQESEREMEKENQKRIRKAVSAENVMESKLDPGPVKRCIQHACTPQKPQWGTKVIRMVPHASSSKSPAPPGYGYRAAGGQGLGLAVCRTPVTVKAPAASTPAPDSPS